MTGGARRHRILAILWILGIVFTVPLTAETASGGNAQKLYPLRSTEYEAVRSLYIEAGLALPFSSGPFSEAEIRLALDRIDTSRLNPSGRDTFDWIVRRLREESAAGAIYREGGNSEADAGGRFAFDIGAEFSLESYLHTDRDNPYWQYRWEDRLPFARFPMEGWVGNHLYGIFDLAFLKGIPDFSIYPTYSADDGQYGFDNDGDFLLGTAEEDPWTNLPVVPAAVDIQFPYRAFLAVGGDHWNATLGRDQIDWGNGRTGNLYISDHVEWYDSLQFSTFWDNFKFSWMWNSLDGTIFPEEREFDEQLAGWDLPDGSGDYDGRVDTATEPDPGANARPVYAYDADEEHKNLVAQRFEVRLWDRLGIAYTMGIIFGREYIELRHLNPIYDYHNLYTNTQWVGNAHRSYELDFAVAPGWSLYGAISPDQWTSPLEPETDLAKEPNAYVALLGVDHRRGIGEGTLHATLEGVYATPWMHIHNHPLTSITNRRFVMAHHSDGPTQLWYDKPIGHYGGNDFALVWFDTSYGVTGSYRYGINASWEGDGSVPINALLESKIDTDLRGELDTDDATADAPSSGYEVDGTERVAMWKNQVTLYGELFPAIGGFNTEGRTLRFASELSGVWIRNAYYRREPWRADLQWVLSTTIGW